MDRNNKKLITVLIVGLAIVLGLVMLSRDNDNPADTPIPTPTNTPVEGTPPTGETPSDSTAPVPAP
jgi:hypothetical protein